jgi:two-component system, NarL family, invasion response regulator UvrY
MIDEASASVLGFTELSCGEGDSQLAMKDGSPGPDDLDGIELQAAHDVRVLVVDDHAFFRGVLRDLVCATPGFALIGEAACGEEALTASDALAPQFVVMDVRMPGLGGIEAARAMVTRDPGLVVLLISAQELPELALTGLSGPGVSLTHKRNLRGALLHEVWAGREGVASS